MQFSQIKVLQNFNLLDKKLEKNGELKDSKFLKIKSYIIYVIVSLNLTRFIISTYYDKYDIYQLYIGSFFNYLDRKSAQFYALDALFIILWIGSIFFNFKYLNSKREDLLLLWLRLSNEIPYDNSKFKLYGISKNKNKKFWQQINKFNQIFMKINKLFMIIMTTLFNVPLLINNYGVNYYLFFSIFLINYVFHLLFVNFLFGVINVLCLFHIELLYFFTKKFDYLSIKIKRLENKSMEFNKLDLVNLEKIIYHFKYCLYYEMNNIDKLFRYYVLFNFVGYFLLALISFFLSLYVDIRLSIMAFCILIAWFFATLYLPFKIGGLALSKVHKVNRSLQNISYRIQLKHKIIINDIGNYLIHYNGFTCYFFPLNSYNSIMAFFDILCYILMLIRIFH